MTKPDQAVTTLDRLLWCPARISARIPTTLAQFLWFSSVPPSECWELTRTQARAVSFHILTPPLWVSKRVARPKWTINTKGTDRPGRKTGIHFLRHDNTKTHSCQDQQWNDEEDKCVQTTWMGTARRHYMLMVYIAEEEKLSNLSNYFIMDGKSTVCVATYKLWSYVMIT